MLAIETLGKQSGRDEFDCGVDELNNWLRTIASQSDRRKNTLTRVALHPDDDRIVGYYATQAYRLDGENLQSAYGSAKAMYPQPAVLLARLARCESVRGEGVGELLIAHALRACVSVSEITGVELVIVHALDESAKRFYERFNFVPFLEHPLHMMLPVKEAAKAFA